MKTIYRPDQTSYAFGRFLVNGTLFCALACALWLIPGPAVAFLDFLKSQRGEAGVRRQLT
jgi:hypothetical protein